MADNSLETDAQVALPTDFAQQVLELQATVDEERCDVTAVATLSNLYRMAVQHFEVQSNQPRSKHYQRKLSRLLMNPRILDLIDNRAKKPQKNQLDEHLHTELEKFNVQAQHCVQTLVQQGHRKLIRSQTLIKLNIDMQQQQLQVRLLRRAKSRKML